MAKPIPIAEIIQDLDDNAVDLLENGFWIDIPNQPVAMCPVCGGLVTLGHLKRRRHADCQGLFSAHIQLNRRPGVKPALVLRDPESQAETRQELRLAELRGLIKTMGPKIIEVSTGDGPRGHGGGTDRAE